LARFFAKIAVPEIDFSPTTESPIKIKKKKTEKELESNSGGATKIMSRQKVHQKRISP